MVRGFYFYAPVNSTLECHLIKLAEKKTPQPSPGAGKLVIVEQTLLAEKSDEKIKELIEEMIIELVVSILKNKIRSDQEQ